ncbi:cbb3-type cytochrome oxidase assembly protein CcoS [uncultured Azonexus sp.]|uniref:cbb3-type cytochrome oxidase assembly protein CcoS n=1 Tax=uncultured Azonexus sp. TaxID=520307 RepID=UPI00261CEA7D|nr:cbb3-type cytochrome oxidase assembly protein CcoS [uncultured Azonexus sp.]
MESVYLLVPISVLLVFGIAAAFWWSVKSGQFDDLEGPGFKVLMDDDEAAQGKVAEQEKKKEEKKDEI